MKKLIMSLLVVCPLFGDLQNKIDKLIPALIAVESRGDLKALNPSENAKGQLQIRKMYLKDVKKVSNLSYHHDDMYHYYPSIEVAVTYLTFWGTWYQKKYKTEPSLEILAKIHNGGPYGWKKKSTDVYWKKIKKVL